jgi:hypothetical protein
LVAGTTPEVSLGQGGCPNDKLPVVPATKPAPGQHCVSLGQTDFGTDPIIVETVKQALDGSATRTPPSNDFVVAPRQNLSLIQLERSSDKSVVEQRLEPLQNQDCLSLIQSLLHQSLNACIDKAVPRLSRFSQCFLFLFLLGLTH